MNQPFSYYSMSQKDFLESAEKLKDRLVQRIKDEDDFMIDRVPGMKKTTWREQLAAFRAREYPQWEQLAQTHPGLARTDLQLYAALTRREQREGVR